jgi:hypothetical protein
MSTAAATHTAAAVLANALGNLSARWLFTPRAAPRTLMGIAVEASHIGQLAGSAHGGRSRRR